MVFDLHAGTISELRGDFSGAGTFTGGTNLISPAIAGGTGGLSLEVQMADQATTTTSAGCVAGVLRHEVDGACLMCASSTCLIGSRDPSLWM